MKRKITFTVLWVLGFPVAVFAMWGATLIPLAWTHHIFAVMYLDEVFKAVFFVSPLVGFWLASRGALPGTKGEREAGAG